MARLGSFISVHYSSAWVYFCSFLPRSCSRGFFQRHTNLTNPSGMPHGRNFPQKSAVTCSINSHPMHLALGQSSPNIGEDLTCSRSPPHRCSRRSHHTFLLQGKKKLNPLSFTSFKCFPVFHKFADCFTPLQSTQTTSDVVTPRLQASISIFCSRPSTGLKSSIPCCRHQQ